MPPTDAEFEELRDRVKRLEVKVAAFTSSPASAPPLLPPVLKPAVGPAAKRSEVSSTVWIAGIGAVIFLIGTLYGLTVAIQRGWLSPGVRVSLGLLTGLMLGAMAARVLLRSSRSLGVALLAAGIGTWTFALYFGAQQAQLFSTGLGFVGTALAVALAGALAARVRSDGALAVALATGLAAPLAFSDGGGSFSGLLTHLLVLTAAQLGVHYMARTGADWRWSRALGTLGVWGVACAGADGGSLTGGVGLIFGLLVLLGAAGLGLAWLPRHPELPSHPGAGTVAVLVMLAVAGWLVWQRAGGVEEWYALPLLLLAAGSLGLVGAARRRTGGNRHDATLLLLSAGFVLVALPVAVDARWVGLGWGALAFLFALGAREAARQSRPEAGGVLLATVIAATAASVVALAAAWHQRSEDWFVLNRVFIGGLLAAGAWGVLMRVPGGHRPVSFLAMQFVAVNLVAWEWPRVLPALQGEQASLAVGGVLATLTYAVAGAGQWVCGVTRSGEDPLAGTLRKAGYGWLAIAALKLLFNDLAGTDLVFRAAAALGVGSVLLGAALWADRQRKRPPGM